MFIAQGPNGFNVSVSPKGNLQTFIGQGPGVNVSPYGEWRWSPMGLAGRDPIFFAQFESEMAYLDTVQDPHLRDTLKQQVTDTCFLCHGAMGKRQFDLDHHADQNFKEEFVFDTKDDENFKYGALARDGISCAICHHMVEDKTPGLDYFLKNSINGHFEVGKPDEITGPFKDDVIAAYPMDTSMGVKPKFNTYITSARLCGSCHTIDLPVVDKAPIGHEVEQNTYLEWVNSQYQNEFQPVLSSAETCQDCHMPGGYTNAANKISVPQIQARIANVEDDSFPAADHRAPAEKIRVRYRETGFGRHELVGINAFLLEMFNQFSWVMGVRTTDYMSGATNDLPNAIDNMVQQAQNSTARVEVSTDGLSIAAPGAPMVMYAQVKVANLAGHRFPSGVGFRRAFIELVVKDASGKVVWGSGRTNELGVIVGADGKPLPTEFFERDANSKQQYQQHYDEEHPIYSEQQVQIYEELLTDAEGNFTTSFLRRDHEVKDNRLLPIGWTEHGPDPSIPQHFLEATYPKGRAWDDPNYRNGKGISIVKYQIPLPPGLDTRTATVTATLYYQSIPPYYLADRFRIGGNRSNTRRLYYLTTNLNWQDTPFINWKLMIASASAPVVTVSRY